MWSIEKPAVSVLHAEPGTSVRNLRLERSQSVELRLHPQPMMQAAATPSADLDGIGTFGETGFARLTMSLCRINHDFQYILVIMLADPPNQKLL